MQSQYYYFKGKALDFIPEFQKEAEELLSKAVKLRPTWCDPLRALAHVYWKKQDFNKSIMWYKNVLEDIPNDKRSLRALSMVIRRQPTKGKDERTKILTDSIDYAKQAVAADLSDSESWYVLGNAHLNKFFMGGQEYEHLDFALKAYLQSEKTQVYENPDLYHNRATIYNYLEQYSNAIDDYEKAHSIDPNLGAKDKALAIRDFVFNVCKVIKKKGSLKSEKFIALVKSVPKSIGEVKFMKRVIKEPGVKLELTEDSKTENEDEKTKAIHYNVLTLSECERGINFGGIFVGKLVWPLPKQQEVPICYLMVDSKYEFSVLSLYHTNKSVQDKLKFGDIVMIRDPNLVYISIKYKKSLLSYPCVKVTDIYNILINSTPICDLSFDPELVTESFTG